MCRDHIACTANNDIGGAKGKVTGGGQVVPTSGGKASFGYIAQRKIDGGPATGHFNYVNHDSGLHINGPVNGLTILSSTAATFSGTWDTNCTFTVYMEDNGEPGVKSNGSGDRLGVSYTCPSPPLPGLPASGTEVPDMPVPGRPIIHGNNQMHKAGTNSAPVANADSVTTAEKVGVRVTVLANDIPDPIDSDAGQTLTVTSVGAPAHGTAVINADNTMTYTPRGYYNGSDSFTYTICDNGTTDGVADPLCATGLVNVTITPVSDPPLPGAITWSASVDPLKVNTSITATASFTELDSSDTHTPLWNWGDGTTSGGTVTEPPTGGGSGSVSGTHTYSVAGLYTVTLTVTDNGGLSGSSAFKYVAVVNPTGGSETGMGSFASPLGAYTRNTTLSGTATITQLSAKYATDGTMTLGTNAFRLSYAPASMSLTSTKMIWLVMRTGKSWLKGEGTLVTGSTSETVNYLVSVVDSTSVADKVRVKIWNKATGTVIYDNQLGSPDDADATRRVDGPPEPCYS